MELELTPSVTSDLPPPKGRSASARPGLAFSPVPSPGVRLEHSPPCLTEMKQPHTIYLRQSLPAAGIIEESESARGERGRVGQGRVGFRV